MALILSEPVAPPPGVVSARQFVKAAERLGHITEAEALDWIARDALPAAVLTVVGALPPTEQYDATADALGMTTAERAAPLIAVALTALGLTEADADALFRLAATL